MSGATVIRWGHVLGIVLLVTGCRSSGTDHAAVQEDATQAPIVMVFNGCGVHGSARMVAEALREAGFDVGNGHGENADSFEYPNTLVVDYVGERDAAQKLADRLGAPMIQQISHDPDRFGTIGVIVGADFRARLAQFHRSQ